MIREKIFGRCYHLWGGLLIGAALGCLVYFVLVPQVKLYLQSKNELLAECDHLGQMQAAAAAFDQETDRLNRAREEYALHSHLFQQVTRDGADLIFLGLTAAASKVAAGEIIPGDIIEKKYTLELPVQVVFQGDYCSLINFFQQLENNNDGNLLEIRSLNIETTKPKPGAETNEGTAQPGTVKAAAGLVIFSLKDPAGKLYREEMSGWLTGRADVFLPTATVTPAPVVAGYPQIHDRQFGAPGPSQQTNTAGVKINIPKAEPAGDDDTG
ncbi:MAG: hypothetical protein HQP61_09920 [Peptococcaceae bacterium]|nr:hypothetical protein [Candidatus Syntrophopropionicum ammoniitolerans]